ncbi:MAG: dTDP-4-dehydrorhamnose reductase [Pseudomonadota bacterium]|nr:dTDP-4-dehydrorhamnose reductase [Pseudomonadota bacterium]
MKIIIFGKTGQVGQEMINLLSNSSIPHLAIGREDVDHNDEISINDIITDYKPSIIINAAAYTKVDEAESNQEEAFAVNTSLPEILAKIGSKKNIFLVHYSTDYIFSGQSKFPIKEIEIPSPLNFYGKTKLEGERKIINNHNKYMILRTSWVYSRYSNNFLKKIIMLLKESNSLNIVNDQFGVPTSAEFLSAITLILLKKYINKVGIYNVVPNGKASWYEFAKVILDCLYKENIITDKKFIKAVPTSYYKTIAKRPLYSVLCNAKLHSIINYDIHDWKIYVRKVMSELKQ